MTTLLPFFFGWLFVCLFKGGTARKRLVFWELGPLHHTDFHICVSSSLDREDEGLGGDGGKTCIFDKMVYCNLSLSFFMRGCALRGQKGNAIAQLLPLTCFIVLVSVDAFVIHCRAILRFPSLSLSRSPGESDNHWVLSS